MKICKGCGIEKELSEFSFNNPEKTKRSGKCKPCVVECGKRHYLANKERINENNKLYNRTHKVELAASSKKFREENSEMLKARQLKQRQLPASVENRVKYNAAHREDINKSHSAYVAKRTEENPMFLKARQMRAHISRTFKRAIENEADLDRYSKILGCTIGHWVNHITSQFKPGMSLKDRSSFQLDHIQPISSATDEESLIKLHHWTNYQPLFNAENAKKGKKIIASLVVKSRVKKLNIDSNNYISI